MPIPGGDPNDQQSSSSSSGDKPQPQPQPSPGPQEKPQTGKEPTPKGGDPARDIYSAQYRHKLLELLREKEGSSRPWGDLPPKVRDEMAGGLAEEFLPGYEGLILEYYKRVQEEAAKEAKKK